jgi:hypothetical protein
MASAWSPESLKAEIKQRVAKVPFMSAGDIVQRIENNVFKQVLTYYTKHKVILEGPALDQCVNNSLVTVCSLEPDLPDNLWNYVKTLPAVSDPSPPIGKSAGAEPPSEALARAQALKSEAYKAEALAKAAASAAKTGTLQKGASKQALPSFKRKRTEEKDWEENDDSNNWFCLLAESCYIENYIENFGDDIEVQFIPSVFPKSKRSESRASTDSQATLVAPR